MNLCLFCLALVDIFHLIVLMIQAAGTLVTFAEEVVGSEDFVQSLLHCLGVELASRRLGDASVW